MTFYDEMQAVATELLTDLGQGTVSLKRTTIGTPPNEWTAGEETTVTYALKATVKRMHQGYEGGVLVIETGDMVTFAVQEVTPLLTDRLVIDGVERVMTNLTPIPGAGTAVAWRAWCAA